MSWNNGINWDGGWDLDHDQGRRTWDRGSTGFALHPILIFFQFTQFTRIGGYMQMPFTMI